MLLQRGSQGNDVIALQAGLRSLGYFAVNVDGIFGPITEQAVKDFQRSAGLTQTGVIDDYQFGILQEFVGANIVGNTLDNVPVQNLLPFTWNPIMEPVITLPDTVVTDTPIITGTPEESNMLMIGAVMLGLTMLMVARKNKVI